MTTAQGNVLIDYQHHIESLDMPAGKKKILLAAMTLFAQQGYNGTSTAQIATESGMSQATIFKHFKTKEELLLAIMTPITNVIAHDLDEEIIHSHDLESLIHLIVTNRFRLVEANQPLFRILVQEVTIHPAIKELMFNTFQVFFERLLLAVRKLGQQDPAFNSQLSDSQLAHIFMSQLGSLLIRYFILELPGDIPQELAMVEKQILILLRN